MAFSIDDYKLKYTWTGRDIHGGTVTLNILQRSGSAFAVKPIRGLAGIRMTTQGAQESVFAPVVKTVLTVDLVDAPDLSQGDVKAGGWQEFYTPDATLYLVQLMQASLGGVTWQGYITPDSWQEGLAYHSSVSITARDNIGRLGDIVFSAGYLADAHGLASIRDIVNEAMDLISLPMTLAIPEGGVAAVPYESHGRLLDTRVCVSELEGKTWGTILEDLLGSIGYCLRYGGFNTVALIPIRNLPLGRLTTRGIAVPVEFYGGTRSLDPAYNSVREEMDYGAQMEVDLLMSKTYNYGTTTAQTYQGTYYSYGTGIPGSFTGRSWRNSNGSVGTRGGWSDGYGYLNPQRCTIGPMLRAVDGPRALSMGVNLAAGQATTGGAIASWQMRAETTDVTLRLEFARPVQLNNATFPHTAELCLGYLMRLGLRVTYTTPGGAPWTWVGTDPSSATADMWVAGTGSAKQYDLAPFNLPDFPESAALDLKLSDISTKAALGGWLKIEIYNIGVCAFPQPNIYGIFARLTAIRATVNAHSVLKTNTVTTVNNTVYNVMGQRRPAFAPLSADVPVLAPAMYPRALWVVSGGAPAPADYAAYFSGSAASTAIPLPVQIHKQMLCYHRTTQQVLEGRCGPVNKDDTLSFGRRVTYKGVEFIIQGGTLDILQNRIESVRLCSFEWYSDLWDESSNPPYSGVPTYDTRSALLGANGNSSIN